MFVRRGFEDSIEMNIWKTGSDVGSKFVKIIFSGWLWYYSC
jgi:hypothetical protein